LVQKSIEPRFSSLENAIKSLTTVVGHLSSQLVGLQRCPANEETSSENLTEFLPTPPLTPISSFVSSIIPSATPRLSSSINLGGMIGENPGTHVDVEVATPQIISSNLPPLPTPISSSVSASILPSRKRKAKEKYFLDGLPEDINDFILEHRRFWVWAGGMFSLPKEVKTILLQKLGGKSSLYVSIKKTVCSLFYLFYKFSQYRLWVSEYLRNRCRNPSKKKYDGGAINKILATLTEGRGTLPTLEQVYLLNFNTIYNYS
jgi:hypothetical protein